jgi:calcineurin-like phosphoesterase family protein
MQIWFCSDFHLGHWNIVKYCNRPFKSLEEMDSIIIKNFNDRVDENDVVFFLGDFCMKKSSEASEAPQNAFDYYRNQLKCKNIIFIKGNHDKNNSTKTIIESIVIEHGGSRIYMTHNPKFAKEDFKFNFCGHVHEKWQFQKIGHKSIICNLSVENWDYRPVTINEINQAYSEWCKRGYKDEAKN